MYRVWSKIYLDNDIQADYVYCNDNPDIDEAEKLKLATEDICNHFDLQQPIWLDGHQIDILRFSKTAFKKDHFIESVDFDYLELEIIEVDDDKNM